MLLFHAIGRWTREQVHVTWSDTDARRRVPEVEQLIEQTWQRHSHRAGIHLFDGPMCRLDRFEAEVRSVRLWLSRTSYKPFFGTNLHNARLADRFGRDVLANPIGVSPALLSSDGFLMLGRRNASVAYYPHRLHPFAGALEPRAGLDVFADVARELREELSFDQDDIADIVLTGLVEDLSLRQPELIFAVRSTRSRGQIESQVDTREHGGSFAIPASGAALDEALREPDEFTPVAIASLLLWGHTVFGGEWFKMRSARFRCDTSS